MKTLIEWCSENGKIPYALGVKGAYEAGRESRQTEVDEANAKASMCRDEKNHAINRWGAICKDRDELQKRVDASNKVLESMRKEIEHGHLSEDESQTLSSYANDLEQALKGGEA